MPRESNYTNNKLAAQKPPMSWEQFTTPWSTPKTSNQGYIFMHTNQSMHTFFHIIWIYNLRTIKKGCYAYMLIRIDMV